MKALGVTHQWNAQMTAQRRSSISPGPASSFLCPFPNEINSENSTTLQYLNDWNATSALFGLTLLNIGLVVMNDGLISLVVALSRRLTLSATALKCRVQNSPWTLSQINFWSFNNAIIYTAHRQLWHSNVWEPLIDATAWGLCCCF